MLLEEINFEDDHLFSINTPDLLCWGGAGAGGWVTTGFCGSWALGRCRAFYWITTFTDTTLTGVGLGTSIRIVTIGTIRSNAKNTRSTL